MEEKDEPRIVAIVGRPNVGKSCLFNRIVGKKVSIVHDQPGVTRDVIAEETPHGFIVMDTGGIGMHATDLSPKAINAATEDQVNFAIQAASLILFVTDAQIGLTALDEAVAQHLRKSGKPVVVAVNKVDQVENASDADPFFKLGFKRVLPVSAEHGGGLEELLDAIHDFFGPMPVKERETETTVPITICFTGRPNVGKSSLGNKLLKQNRLIVSDMPGTTRDAVKVAFDYRFAGEKEPYRFQLIDTAGMRHRSKINTSVEFFSSLRTEQSLAKADIIFLVVDAVSGVTDQDKKLAGQILEFGKGVAIIVNKWDVARKQFREEPLKGYKNVADFQKGFAKAVQEALFFLPSPPIVFTCALGNSEVTNILKVAKELCTRLNQKLPTSKVNQVMLDLVERQKPKIVMGKRFRVYYSLQVANRPYKIKVFCNQVFRLEDVYRRYLENNFVNAFKLQGCPIIFEFIGKPPRPSMAFEGSHLKKRYMPKSKK